MPTICSSCGRTSGKCESCVRPNSAQPEWIVVSWKEWFTRLKARLDSIFGK